MNTEKLEKLKKSLDNKFIPDNMKDKIRAEIKKLEADIKTDETITATEVKEEVKEIEKKVEKALEVAEEKEEQAEAKKEEAQEKAEAKAEEKKAKNSRTKTPKTDEKPKSAKKSVFSIAKEIRKDNESWEDAKERARKMMKSETTETKKKTRTETDKLLAMVRRKKELKGLTSNVKRDINRTALPKGKRISENGKVYYEYRDDHSDRLAPSYNDKIYLAKGGEIEMENYNLYFVGRGRDVNGNKVIKISFPNQKPFSIQTLGNLPKTHRILREYDNDKDITPEEIDTIEREVISYVEEFGSKKQKESLRKYEGGGGVDGIIELKPLELIPLSTQLNRLSGYNWTSGDWESEDGGKPSTMPNSVIVNVHTKQKFRLSPFYVYKGIDHYNSKPLYRVEDMSEEGEYVGEWYTNREDAVQELKEMFGSYAEKGVYVETLDEEIDLTDDGKPRVIKTQQGGNKSFGERREMHGASPEALAFDNGGSIEDEKFKKFINSQVSYIISLKTISQKREPIQNLLDNMEDYRSGSEIVKRITTDNLKYALQQKTVSKMNEVLRISLNALQYANGGRTRERRYVNHSQDYEVRYSKDKPHRRGYGYAEGGTIIGTPETPLARGLDIDYTGLVGETGGMSAGEMFAEGGSIENQYEGKTPSQIWSMLSVSQKYHFLEDHSKEIESTPMSIEKATKTAYKFLPTKIKKSFEHHVEMGQYAMGGSLGNHGLKQGDEIIKTMSGGVQKVKTKSGDIVYVNLANGYRGVTPPLPFAKGGYTNERRHVNKAQDYEVRYAKNKPNRTGYSGKRSFEEGGFQNGVYATGGGVDGLKRFDVDFYKSISDKDTSEEKILRSDSFEDIIENAIKIAKKENYSYIEIYHKELFIGSMKDKDDYDFKKGRNYENNPLKYATGGLTKNYINRNQLNTITIKKGDKKLTYKVSDVYNGAYKLEDGGNLERTAFYVSKRNVVKVQLKDGKDVKVANGYWIKKGAKPIHTSKYDDGGQLEMEYAGGGETKMIDGVMYEKVKFSNGVEDYYYSSDLHKVNSYCEEYGLNPKNQKDFEKAFSELKKQNKISYKGGGKTTFKEKATAIAKNFEGKKVEPKYQKEYGKTYDKAEAKEVGNKIAGSQKAKYDSKMSGGGSTKRGGAMQLAKQIRKDGESWQSALKRANEQMRNK